MRLREPHQSPRYTLRVFDDASQCAGNSNQPFDPGARRINQRAGTGAADSARRTERIDRAALGRSRRSIPSRISIPRQIARAASVSASPSGWPIACSVKPARDRAGDGDELIGRCGHGRSCEAARHCLGVGAFRQPLARRGQTRFEEAHRPALPVRQPVGVASLGTDHAGQPGRRGSRDSGQTANMVLLVIQIETSSPEQRVGAAAEPWPKIAVPEGHYALTARRYEHQGVELPMPR